MGDFGSHFREEKESDENLRKQVLFEILVELISISGWALVLQLIPYILATISSH
jgi:hypothetical protein